MGAWAGRFHLLALLGGGGDDTQALKGSKRAGWDIKIKTCKFLSCPPAWATPAFLRPTFEFHTFLDFNRSGLLQTLKFFVLFRVTEGHLNVIFMPPGLQYLEAHIPVPMPAPAPLNN